MPTFTEVQIVLIALACTLLVVGPVIWSLKRWATPSEEDTLEQDASRFMVECHEEVYELLARITEIEEHWLRKGRHVPEEDAMRIKGLEDRILAAQFAYQETSKLLKRERARRELRSVRERADAAGASLA